VVVVVVAEGEEEAEEGGGMKRRRRRRWIPFVHTPSPPSSLTTIRSGGGSRSLVMDGWEGLNGREYVSTTTRQHLFSFS